MLDIERLALVWNCFFDRDNMKAQPSAAGRYHVRNAFHRQIAHLIGKLSDLLGHTLKKLFVVD